MGKRDRRSFEKFQKEVKRKKKAKEKMERRQGKITSPEETELTPSAADGTVPAEDTVSKESIPAEKPAE